MLKSIATKLVVVGVLGVAVGALAARQLPTWITGCTSQQVVPLKK